MVNKRLLSIIFSIIVFLSLSPATLTCACCAETGHYSIWTGKPDKSLDFEMLPGGFGA